MLELFRQAMRPVLRHPQMLLGIAVMLGDLGGERLGIGEVVSLVLPEPQGFRLDTLVPRRCCRSRGRSCGGCSCINHFSPPSNEAADHPGASCIEASGEF